MKDGMILGCALLFLGLSVACSQAEVYDKQVMPMVAVSESLVIRDLKTKDMGVDEEPMNTEDYAHIAENEFYSTVKNPLSTFSVDVDTASYANVRRFVNEGSYPPPDAVRIEEFINYFTYNYPEPEGEHPFSITTEVADCPWNNKNKIVMIGLKGKSVDLQSLPANNLVFLLDVSGSMDSPNKLPLLKEAFKLIVRQMRPIDKVAIVVYAGAAGVVLPSTKGDRQAVILEALNQLEAGGSTAGGEGIVLAYKIAKENFIKGGNNRIILASDGDFNVGVSSEGELTRLIEEKRKEGIFLTVLGFGMGNYKDDKMELLADKGNGNYAYIDSMLEAKKVLVSELGGTLLTIAKDVKIQIEFNPAKIKSYRLVGYENRVMRNEDFEDDTKDAGEIGAGHNVTAIYEIVLSDGNTDEDDLKYSETKVKAEAFATDEILTVKFRYKKPDGDKSLLISQAVKDNIVAIDKASENLRFACAVIQYALVLRDSKFKGSSSFASAIKLAEGALGQDKEGYRKDFIELVKKTINLKK